MQAAKCDSSMLDGVNGTSRVERSDVKDESILALHPRPLVFSDSDLRRSSNDFYSRASSCIDIVRSFHHQIIEIITLPSSFRPSLPTKSRQNFQQKCAVALPMESCGCRPIFVGHNVQNRHGCPLQ